MEKKIVRPTLSSLLNSKPFCQLPFRCHIRILNSIYPNRTITLHFPYLNQWPLLSSDYSDSTFNTFDSFSSPFTFNWLLKPTASISTISFHFPQCIANSMKNISGGYLSSSTWPMTFTHRMGFRKLWSSPAPVSKVGWTLIKAVPITFCLLGIWS